MMYRVNMIYSISRNSAFPEVGGRTQCLSPYLPISRNSAVSEVGVKGQELRGKRDDHRLLNILIWFVSCI